jgi:hypothetical protein
MGCKVKANWHQYLAFRLYWDGYESWQGTDLKDTPKNRERAEARAVLISEQIENGSFNYLKWFPNGNRASKFRQEFNTPEPTKPQTVREFYERWIERKKPPFVRLSLERDYRQNFTKNILPFMGHIELSSISIDVLEDFRIYLVEDRKLALKTTRNIIDGSLRAMIRDAAMPREGARLIDRNPFNDLPANWWPRVPQKEPDPYSEQERDQILKYYRNNRPFGLMHLFVSDFGQERGRARRPPLNGGVSIY